MPSNELWEGFTDRQAREEQWRQNAAREATTYFTFVTEGAGVVVPEDAIPLDTPYLHEPSVSTGVVLTRPPDPDYWDFPLVTAGVVRWDRTERGFYIGAFMFYHVRVDMLQGVTDPPMANPKIVHHLRFTGLSYKAVGETLAVEDGELAEPKIMPKVP